MTSQTGAVLIPVHPKQTRFCTSENSDFHFDCFNRPYPNYSKCSYHIDVTEEHTWKILGPISPFLTQKEIEIVFIYI